MKTISRLSLVLLVALPTLLLAGCNNIGDTNPTSPDQMQQIRAQQEKERQGFNPGTKR